MNTIDSHLTLEDANPANKTDLKSQLRHLDSIRALAALCVVVYHAYSETANSLPQNLPHGLTWVFDRLLFGTAYVDIFIVLSGFCLTISLARSNVQTLIGGNLKYFIRRARRILPPYFAAYILSSLLLLIIPAIDHLPGKYSGGELQPFSPIVIITHLLLIHNLYPNWQISSNVALWSVATEWQIYFIMPAFLLPLRNRYGLGILILGAFGLGLLLTVLGTYGARFWFIALFALGMSAAYILYDATKIKVIKASKLIGCAFYLIAFLIHLKSPEAKTLDTIVIEDACIG
ncbi:MAG: acyltransferase 3, partial [Capsulimonas sp.]|nr:acyltransferase 3 [Capsulimonas sp.]